MRNQQTWPLVRNSQRCTVPLFSRALDPFKAKAVDAAYVVKSHRGSANLPQTRRKSAPVMPVVLNWRSHAARLASALVFRSDASDSSADADIRLVRPHRPESEYSMIPAPIPADDERRLNALRKLLILDTPPEERFDRIVDFAATEFDMPIVLVSLVDRDRQWFKARVGLSACETGREISFCGHAIMYPGILVVEDACRDERFSDNPLVTGAPGIRFYAGAPLILATGESVGTLCLIDTVPRQFDAVDRSILSTLRQLVVEELQSIAEKR